MIDDFLTSAEDLPHLRPRVQPRRPDGTTPPEANAETLSQANPPPEAPVGNASRTAIAAGVLLAATVVGSAPGAETPPVPKAGTSSSRAG